MGAVLIVCSKRGPTSIHRFSSFKLLYGRQPLGVLDVLQEEWESPAPQEEVLASYLEDLRRKLRASVQLAQTEIGKAEEGQKQQYDAQVKPRSFEVGQRVLLFLP